MEAFRLVLGKTKDLNRRVEERKLLKKVRNELYVLINVNFYDKNLFNLKYNPSYTLARCQLGQLTIQTITYSP